MSLHLKLASVALAAILTISGADHLSGTWKMNPAKSKYDPGPMPKSASVTFSTDGDWQVVKTESVSAEGKAFSATNRYKYDGKEYPYKMATGDTTRAYKKTGDHNYEFTSKAGKGVSKGVVVTSKDGKTRTLTVTGTDKDGKPVNVVAVYEK